MIKDPEPTATSSRRELGLTAFTIEGRRAPALFVVGWLGTLIGTGLAVIGLAGPAGVAGTVVWVAALLAWSIGLILLGGSQALERAAAGTRYAGPSPLLVFLAIVPISQLAGYAIGLPLSAIADQIPRALGDLLAVLVQALVFFTVLRVMVVGTGAMTWDDMGMTPFGPGRIRELLGGALYAGPVILVTAVLALVVTQLAGATPASPLPPTGSVAGLLLHLAAGAILAPVAEESLFRGFALSAWRRTIGTQAAVVRTSILFVLAHVLFVGGETFGEAVALAFVAGVVRIPIALTLGWLFVRTGSLWASIGLHAAFNAILIVLGESAAAG